MNRFMIILSVVLFLFLSGCSDSGLPENSSSDGLSEIPETLIVNADLPQNLPTTASVYEVSLKDFDSSQLLELFHMEPDSFRERDAFGQVFESGDSLLRIYDDEGVLPGGFSYIADIPRYTHIISVIEQAYNNADFMRDKAPDDFSDTGALSFLDNIGLGEMEIEQVYRFSGEELNEFIKSSDEFTSQDEGAFQPEDQYFLVRLLQSENGIPFITTPWATPGTTQTDSEAQVIIFENEMIDARFTHLYDVGQEIDNGKIISPEAALNAFIADYNKKMQFDTTTITNISFYYVVTVDKDGMYAQPAYFFEYEYGAVSDSSPEPVIIKENKVISAMSGEFILLTEVGI